MSISLRFVCGVVTLLAVSFAAANIQAQDPKKPRQAPEDVTRNRVENQLQVLLQKREDLRAHYGDKHAKVVQVESQLALLRAILNKREAESSFAKMQKKRAELDDQLQQLEAEKMALQQKFGKAHPKVQLVDSQIGRWRLLADKLPQPEMKQDPDRTLNQATELLLAFQESKNRQKQSSLEEEAVLQSIDKLLRAKRAAEAKRAMELLLQKDLAQKQWVEQAKVLDRALLESQEKQKKLDDMGNQLAVDNQLLKRKNEELVEMQNQLKLAEERLKTAQADMVARAHVKSARNLPKTQTNDSIIKKLNAVEDRMARMEKMMSRLVEKLDKDDRKKNKR